MYKLILFFPLLYFIYGYITGRQFGFVYILLIIDKVNTGVMPQRESCPGSHIS
jgi:hypothetical protein